MAKNKVACFFLGHGVVLFSVRDLTLFTKHRQIYTAGRFQS